MLSFSVILAASLNSQKAVAEIPVIPEIAGKQYLDAFFDGVAKADALEKPLKVVCLGDSNTEGSAYAGPLRQILQGCYGDRGIGYHTFGKRLPLTGAPEIKKTGEWTDLSYWPETPERPWFAIEGLWTTTDDTEAMIGVKFDDRDYPGPVEITRIYDSQHSVRIHYQTGPEEGAFSVFRGAAEIMRIDTRNDEPGYGMTEPFMAREFRIAGITGNATPLGMDVERISYFRGEEVAPGGAIVYQLGRCGARVEMPAAVEPASYEKFFRAIQPDLITILYGTNDMHNLRNPQVYREGMGKLIDLIRLGAPDDTGFNGAAS